MNRKLIIIIGVVVVLVTITVIAFMSLNSGSSSSGISSGTSSTTTGSSNTGSGSSNTSTSSTGGATKSITVWGLWEPESVMEPIITAFETANPNIKVEYTQKSFSQYSTNLFTRLSKGSSDGNPVPDVVMIHNTWTPKYKSYLYPAPATSISSTSYKTVFYPESYNSFVIDGKVYAAPVGIDGLVMYYNKKHLSAIGIDTPPDNWDEFIEVAKKLTKADSNGKITQAGAALGGSNIMHSSEIMLALMLQNGVDVSPNSSGIVELKGEEVTTAFNFYIDFVKTHKVWSPTSRTDLDMFMSDKVSIMFAPSWRAFDIINGSPQLDFGIAPFPQIPNNDPVYLATYWAMAVPSTAENPNEAWKFISYATESAQLKELNKAGSSVRAFGQIYPRQDMASLLKGDPYAGAIVSSAPHMYSWSMGEQEIVENAINKVLKSADSGGTLNLMPLQEEMKKIKFE